MLKQEHIAFWLAQADDDWDAVSTLFNGKNYLQSLFFTHLVIEKTCKAIWIKCNESNMPPRTHNLIFILSQTDVVLQEQTSEFLLFLNRFQLEGRYPDYMTKMHNVCTTEFTKDVIEKTKKLRLWLIEKLQ